MLWYQATEYILVFLIHAVVIYVRISLFRNMRIVRHTLRNDNVNSETSCNHMTKMETHPNDLICKFLGFPLTFLEICSRAI